MSLRRPATLASALAWSGWILRLPERRSHEVTRRVVGRATVLAVLGSMLLPLGAAAQSSIGGVVRDEGGGVLPGVAIEAASPVLIEKVRSVVSDGQGRYSIVDLRPGGYRITFTLQGFSTIVRDGIDLPSNFNATVNIEMKVGSLEESVTVTGQSPLVDVESTQKTTALPREVLDSVPTARTFQAEAAIVVGITVDSPNVGGVRKAGTQRLLVHGLDSVENTVEVDGMKMNTMNGDGDSQPNHNDAMAQEVTVQTSGPGADVSGGGVRLNLIPRDGGNTFSGSMFFGYANNAMQGSNVTPQLVAQGLASGDFIEYVSDFNPSVGGPIVRDRLWFFLSAKDTRQKNYVANTFFPDGSPGLYDQDVQNLTGRLTFQMTPRNKVAAFYDKAFKHKDYDIVSGDDPSTAAKYWSAPNYYTGAVKWTSTVSSRVLLETGWAAIGFGINSLYRPGAMKTRGTPEWYANASRQDIVLGTRRGAGTVATSNYPYGHLFSSGLTYATGSHTFKTGVQWRYGTDERTAEMNADLIQRYRTRVPDSVIVYNTPSRAKFALNGDTGIYVQDTLRFRRLTITPGVRFELFNASIEENLVEPGRFVGLRSQSRVENLPDWFDIAPRFGITYDLTGDAQTALKASANKYYSQWTTGISGRYSPMSLQSDTRNWSDCDYTPGTSTCSGRALPTNGDDIAQDNEIGPRNNARFGQAPARRADPDLEREYTVEYSVGVDHQLREGLAVSFSWFRRTWGNLESQVNTLVDSTTDFTAFQTVNPQTSQPLTLYNLNRAKQGLVDLLDTNSADSSKSNRTFTGFEGGFSLRFGSGGSLFGGFAAARTVSVLCELADPNTRRNCDQSLFDIPFTTDVKIAGTYPLPWNFNVGGAIQSYAGKPLAVNWAVPSSVFPGGQRTQPVTVNLADPGSKYLERWNQLDVNVTRRFQTGRVRLGVGIDLFNLLNENAAILRNQNFGSSLDQPTQILQPKMARLSLKMEF